MKKTILDFVKYSEDYALSDSDIRDILDNKVNIVNYVDLKHYTALEPVLGVYNAVVLLIPVSSVSNGHWLCMYYDSNNNRLVYYNSYGLGIGADLKISPYKDFHDNIPDTELFDLITDFVRRRRCKLDINKHQHQILSDKINTCGRHACVRLLFRDLSNGEYDMFIRNNGLQSVDMCVTYLTIAASLRHEIQ